MKTYTREEVETENCPFCDHSLEVDCAGRVFCTNQDCADTAPEGFVGRIEED